MKVAPKKRVAGLPGLIMLFAVFILMNSCNNSGKSNEDDDTTNTAVKEPERIRDQYYALKLPASRIDSLFTSNNADSVVEMFYFNYTEYGSAGYTLTAYGATRFGNRVTPQYTLDTLGNGSTLRYAGPNPPAYKQIFTRGYLKGFWGLPPNSSTTIPRNRMTDIWLTPCLKPFTDTLTYVAVPAGGIPYVCPRSWKTVVGLIHTNPSPPDGACYNSCDQPQLYPIIKDEK